METLTILLGGSVTCSLTKGEPGRGGGMAELPDLSNLTESLNRTFLK